MKHKIVQVNWRDPCITYETDKKAGPSDLSELTLTSSWGWIIHQDKIKTIIGHVDYGGKVDMTIIATSLIEGDIIKNRKEMDHEILEIVFKEFRKDRSADKGEIDKIKNLDRYFIRENYAYGYEYKKTNKTLILAYEESESGFSYIPIHLEDIIKINKR